MSDWGGSSSDFSGEPRKVFVNFLIFNLKHIEFQLFFGGSPKAAIKSLRGLICSLDGESQKKLDEQLKELIKFDDNKLAFRNDIEKIYRNICAYLHKEYLTESYYATPRYPKRGKLGKRDESE